MTSPNYPSHECGVFAVYGHPNAALLSYYGLFALQHRGQESAGIVAHAGAQTSFRSVKRMGLVSQIFKEKDLEELAGSYAIGHVRYSTTGSSNLLNAQPLSANTSRGQLAIAHNGNLINALSLRLDLEKRGAIFQTTSDSEIILLLLAQPILKPEATHPLGALRQLEGAFSLVIMGEREIIGVRDPHGFRPLSLGKLDNAWILSSETCAFDLLGADFVRDLEPGEALIINESGLHSEFPFQTKRESFCIFEYIYFARPDSNLRNINVSQTRVRLGQELARLHPVDADLVVPIPDSGIYGALGFSEELKIPYQPAFVRNHYVGRTFIEPTQLMRDFSVRVKLNLIESYVKGKRVVIVDDSIVRGTTARNRVINLRQAGAREVHLRITCSPHRHACYYGIDFPNPKDLIANEYSMEDLAAYLGADSVGYLDIEGMVRATRLPKESFCLACFTGEYPIPFDTSFDKFMMEEQENRTSFLPERA